MKIVDLIRRDMVVAELASALACKYAVTADVSFRDRAVQALEESRSLSKTPEEQKAFKEYSERINHRLTTREIIDKREYDRRFRQKPKEGSK